MDKYSRSLLRTIQCSQPDKLGGYSHYYLSELTGKSFDETRRTASYLVEIGCAEYIEVQPQDSNSFVIGVKLTHKGAHYSRLQAISFRNWFFSRFFAGFISGILVGVLAGILVAYLTFLFQWN